VHVFCFASEFKQVKNVVPKDNAMIRTILRYLQHLVALYLDIAHNVLKIKEIIFLLSFDKYNY